MNKDQYKLSQNLKEVQEPLNTGLSMIGGVQGTQSGQPPITTGTNVTTGFTPTGFGDLFSEDIGNFFLQYGDNTAFTPNEAGEMQTDMATTSEPKEINRNKFRKMSPYFFTKGEDDSSNLLGLINNLLVPKKMKMGGAISSPSLSLGRRMYNMPKKKKTVMQTSTKGMPMRGMQSGVPMMKQGGMTKKKYHI
jgi:hypothetical protein